jgi:hypothetical protein
MIHKSNPSALFLDSIHAAFHLAQGQGQGEVTVADIWNHVVGLCLRRTPTFAEMFAWDVRCKPSSKRNRVADIATAIEQCYVPELRLDWNEKCREIVIHIVTRLDQLDDQNEEAT